MFNIIYIKIFKFITKNNAMNYDSPKKTKTVVKYKLYGQ